MFFPAFNDAKALPDLLARTFEILTANVTAFEVIVVNDGSSDETAEVLDELREQYYPHLRLVTHAENRGYGAALRSGFAAASNEFVFYTDGDGQYDPRELASLLNAVTANTGLVNGYKIERHDPWHRVAIGWLYNKFARTLFRIKLRDIDCDFRLIRRSVLNDSQLISTSGTICVELVRRLEMSGAEVVELPVHHYPRLHGSSQFFRLRSLAHTFFQLCALFWQLVLLPFLRTPAGSLALVFSAVVGLSFLAYARALGLPFISDDYLQITLGRRYGAMSGWPALFQDVLYRCRATSLVLTYWTEHWFGLNAFAFNLSSLGIHILNSLLVFGIGLWRPVGWRVSAIAACLFAVSQRHQEAVIWYSAVPELLVFFFGVSSFLCWVWWLQSERRHRTFYWGAFGLFVAALLSKESAVVVPVLMLMAAVLQRPCRRETLLKILPFGLCAIGYFGLIFAARNTHLHFNDAGTFSLNAPVLQVLFRSSVRLIGFWGVAAIAVLVAWRNKRWFLLAGIAGTWMVVTLVPYSFLTYMPSVPSRHTYLASVGNAFLMAAALLELHARTPLAHRRRVLGVVIAAIVAQQCEYLWTRKQAQFQARAWPTEELLRIAERSSKPIYVKCFPYDRSVAELALQVGSRGSSIASLVFRETDADGAVAVDLCNAAGGDTK